MKLHRFGGTDPLSEHSNDQAKYLRCYLSDLGAKSVIEEPEYFDRDYLDEFSAYYSRVATPTPNRCKRLHFFGRTLTQDQIRSALDGPGQDRSRLEASYLGFVVVRPLKHAPLGRAVIKWYPDNLKRYQGNPRVTPATRDYVAHLAGLSLRVQGLAWQQQDGAVALCATTALWSMLHSSAFDDHHAVPTTAEVTRLAYHSVRQGLHVFPASDGLDVRQMTDAIARAKLTPMLMVGDATASDGERRAFSREKFAACAVMLRSGFPVRTGTDAHGEGTEQQNCTDRRVSFLHLYRSPVSKESAPMSPTPASSQRFVIPALAAVYFIWGSTYLAMRVAVEGLPPFMMASARFVLTGLVLLGFLKVRGAPWPTLKQWLAATPVGALMFVLGNGTVAYAEKHISSGVAAVVCGTMPLWVAAFGRFFGEKTTPREWLALVLGFGGVAVLSMGGELKADPFSAVVLFAAPLSWALGSLLARRLPLATGLMSAATQMLAGGVVMAFVSLAARGKRCRRALRWRRCWRGPTWRSSARWWPTARTPTCWRTRARRWRPATRTSTRRSRWRWAWRWAASTRASRCSSRWR